MLMFYRTFVNRVSLQFNDNFLTLFLHNIASRTIFFVFIGYKKLFKFHKSSRLDYMSLFQILNSK